MNKKDNCQSCNQLSSIISFDLIDELIQFQGQIAYLGDSIRHSLLETRKFDYSQYNVKLNSLLKTHVKKIQQLENFNPADDSL